MKKSTVIRVIAIILGVIVIPLAYSLLYLSAFNDPYSKLSTLPIAVVNLDKGAVIDDTQRNIGNELVDKLKEDDQLGWRFTNEEDAENGVNDTKYYAEITIPETFSANIASAQDTTKTTSTITYKMNEKRNYLASQIIQRVMVVMQSEVSSDVDKELTVELTKKFDEVPDKMNELNNGLGDLKDGTQQLADGTSNLKDGTSTLKNGTQQLADGAGNLKNGTASLKNGTQQLADGASSLKDGTASLKDGTQRLADGTASLKDGSVKLVNGVQALDNGMTTIASGSSSLSSNLFLYKTNFNTLVSQESLLNTGVKAKLPLLITGVSSLDQGILKCFTGSSTLSAGISQYSAGFGKFALGQKALANGADANLPLLVGGIQNFNNGVNNITLTDPKTQQSYTTNFADVTAQYVDGVGTLQQSYAGLLGSLQDCATTQDPALFQQKFAAIMQNLQKNQTAMQQQSQQLQAAGQLMKDNSKNICTGASGLNASVTQIQALQQGIDQLESSTEQLQTALASIQQGSNDLTDGLSQAKTGADALNDGAQALTTGDNNMADSIAKLTDALSQLQAATEKLSSGAQSLDTGIQSAKSGTSQLNNQVPSLQNGVNDLNSGAVQVNSGAAQVNDGANSLNSGAQQVNSGASQVNDGANSLNSGAQQVNSGASQVKDGASKLNDGASQVNSGVQTAKDGVQTSIGDTNQQLDKLNGLDDYSANPVSLTEEKTESVPNYGTAFAPYFMSLSLWVGALIMFFGIYLDPDKRMPLLSRSSDRKLVRIAGFSGIGFAQAFMLAMLVKWVLNLQVNNIVGYYIACVLISMVFISIVQFFIVHLGDVGKLLAIIMLIFQLTSCGGTFPMETVPKLFNVLYPFMPMTYSVNILKETISGHSSSIIAHNALILVGIGVAFTVLTIVFSIIKRTTSSDNNSKSITA